MVLYKVLSSNNNSLLISIFFLFFLSYHFIYISLKGLFGSGQILSNSVQRKQRATELGHRPITFSYNWMQFFPLKPRETVKVWKFVFGGVKQPTVTAYVLFFFLFHKFQQTREKWCCIFLVCWTLWHALLQPEIRFLTRAGTPTPSNRKF